MENKVYYGEYSLIHWIDLILKKNIILPEYQRYFVWDEKKVKTLVDTFLKKEFVPPVTIGAFKNNEKSQNIIIDGQQRLTSILLVYLGLYPNKEKFKSTLVSFADENDTEVENEEKNDNFIEWTFEQLVDKGVNKEEILSKCKDENYKNNNFIGINNNIDDFFQKTFLGFSYLVPFNSEEKQQQKYYSSIFRNINIQGEALIPQESRASLYYLDKDLVHFFEPVFAKNYSLKILGNVSKIDIVRYLALLSQYYKDKDSNNIARSYKPKMEKYYEEYIYSVVNDTDDRYGKFSDFFPNRQYIEYFTNLKNAILQLDIPNNFSSIIELDMYYFGLIYIIVFDKKNIKIGCKEELKQKILDKISIYKGNPKHTKAPNNLGYLRERITSSIQIYMQYAL